MSKCAIYAVNQFDQPTIAAQTIISFPDIVRKFGCNTTISGGNLVVAGYGYYNLDVHLTFTAGDTSASFQLYDDGVAIPGTEVSLVTVDDGTYSVTIPAIIKRSCDCESTITVGVTGVGTVTDASIRLVKL